MTLTELTAEIVSAHSYGSNLTSEQLLINIQAVYNTLKKLETGESISAEELPVVEIPTAPTMTVKQSFKNKDEVLCMICGKGFKTLKVHLAKAHDLKPVEYRNQFGIPSSQSLAAKSYVESRRQMAVEKGLGAGLVKYRADKKAEDAKKADVPATTEVKAPAKAKKAPAVKATVKVKK